GELAHEALALVAQLVGVDDALGLAQGEDADAQGPAGEVFPLPPGRTGEQCGDAFRIGDVEFEPNHERGKLVLPDGIEHLVQNLARLLHGNLPSDYDGVIIRPEVAHGVSQSGGGAGYTARRPP